MKIIELAEDEVLTESMLSRKGALPASVIASAAAIVEEVREKKDDALRAFESKFDHVDIADFRVPQQVIDASLDEVGEEFLTRRLRPRFATFTSARCSSRGSRRVLTVPSWARR